jgi:hypothetical protein
MNRGMKEIKDKIGAKEVILIAIFFVIILYFIMYVISQ